MYRLLVIICAALPVACAAQRAAGPQEAVPLRAVVISDLNSPYGSTHYTPEVHHVIARIVSEWRPDVVLIAGDMVAGQAPQLPDSVVLAMWREFDRVVAAPLRAAAIPLVVTLGNHDGSAYPAHARDRRLAASYWRGDPAPAGPLPLLGDHDYPLHYAARFGDVFIAAWDATNQESARDSVLLHWLQRALGSAEARTARHRVVLGHLPMYGVAAGRDRPGEVLVHGDSLRRQLETWGATLFISGHHHAAYPGRRGGLDLLHAGALGDGPRQLVDSDAPPRRTVTRLEFHADSLAMETWEVQPDGRLQLLPLDSFPPVICGAHGWVARRDRLTSVPAPQNDPEAPDIPAHRQRATGHCG